jgi:hypothetical protein
LGFEQPKRHLGKGALAGLLGAAVVALVGIVVAVMAMTGHLAPSHETPIPTVVVTAPTTGEAGATEWSLNRAFEAGDFTVTMTSYRDQETSLGPEGTWTSENGQFVLISLTVEYTGEGQGTFLPGEQHLLTESGERFTNDVQSALLYRPETLGDSPLVPGQPQEGALAFDISRTDPPVALEIVGVLGENPVIIPLG